jgi:Nickel responsive protein SCO4226-like
MPKYIIEREMPGIGGATIEQLRAGSANSNKVVADLGPEIRWLESFITEDTVYCVYVAPSEEIIIEHARCAGLPADRISKVAAVTDPSWGE